MEAIFSLVLLGLLVFIFLFIYRKRRSLAMWLNAPDAFIEDDPQVRRLDVEHRIAVLQRRLEILDEMTDYDDSQGTKVQED